MNAPSAYSLPTTTGFLSADQIVRMLDPTVAVQLAHIRSIEALERDGVRYSNQDFDVLAGAFRAIGQQEPRPHQVPWVEAMTSPASRAA